MLRWHSWGLLRLPGGAEEVLEGAAKAFSGATDAPVGPAG